MTSHSLLRRGSWRSC
uniref:Uncharacterized protein n=1 Tax=Arundo donax TaxID=35708 RepID=A0A0A9BVJ1_ARUDO